MFSLAYILGTSLALFSSYTNAQLSGPVGPLTSRTAKAAIKVCNVLDYGAKANGITDIGPPISSAWAACKTGGIVYIPPGTYAMATWVDLKKGSKVALQLDGTIIRTGTAGGNMIGISGTTDFEFFSGNSQGAIQGYGYQYISKGTFGARFIRFTNVNNFSFHGVALVDSASYYTVFDSCSNGEIYNLILRGIRIGETDGIDIWGTNIWVHDVEVTNGDECVTIKSPAKNILVESVHCNRSGGCAIGSLGIGTDISFVQYNNIYENNAGGLYIKSYGGTGTMTSCSFNNFILHGSAYMLTNNAYWNHDSGGAGVQFSNLSYSNWRGTNIDSSRPVIRYICPDAKPCYGISLSNINLWTTDGSKVNVDCRNAYGTGYCLRSGNVKNAYADSITTISVAPSYDAPTMPNDHKTEWASTKSFTIPPVPTTFFPGLQPKSALLLAGGPGGGAGATTKPGVTTKPTSIATLNTSTKSMYTQSATSKTPTATRAPGSVPIYGQCGGSGWTGPTTCMGSKCTYSNEWYSQCL